MQKNNIKFSADTEDEEKCGRKNKWAEKLMKNKYHDINSGEKAY